MSMNIDEAIRHYKAISNSDCGGTGNRECIEKYRKQAEWLEELKQLRKEKEMSEYNQMIKFTMKIEDDINVNLSKIRRKIYDTSSFLGISFVPSLREFEEVFKELYYDEALNSDTVNDFTFDLNFSEYVERMIEDFNNLFGEGKIKEAKTRLRFYCDNDKYYSIEFMVK